MSKIAIIPARSGSKGVKDKNIRELAGKPLIAYTIEAAIKSGVFDEVMVSTDSKEYAEIAKQYGANVPFLRSKETSTDEASSWDMVREVINQYGALGRIFDSFCLLQPTSPLRDSFDICGAYELYNEKNAIAVISVCEAEHAPVYCGHLDEHKSLANFIKREKNVRRQELGKYYRLNGAIYIANIEEFIRNDHLYRDGCYAYIMDTEKSVDIDSELDIKYAEFLIERYNKYLTKKE